MYQQQGIPYTVVARYANGTALDMAFNTWLTIDSTSADTPNGTVTIDIDQRNLGSYTTGNWLDVLV